MDRIDRTDLEPINFRSNEVDHSDEYIKRWIPIIQSWAADRRLSSNFDFDDRVQYGMIGLWRAINSYDPVKHPKVPLTAWISRKVKRYMLDGSLHESGRGGGGYTYGHVIHIEDLHKKSDSKDSRERKVTSPLDIFEHLRVDSVAKMFEYQEGLERVDKIKAVITSIENGDFLLKWLDGMTMKAIGAEIGRSESYISKKLTIVRYLLREKLDE